MDYTDYKADGRLVSTEMQDPMEWVRERLPIVVAKAHRQAQSFNVWLADNLGDLGEFKIDEVALHFRSDDEEEFKNFLMAAVTVEGYDLFNTAWDKVQTYPIRSRYFVNYAFLSTPYDFRLECMRVDRGTSPLHTPLDSRDGSEPVTVHFSFKCPDGDVYTQVFNRMLNKSPDSLVHVMGCKSTYGEFSYWSAANFPMGVYLKPRANLRERGRSNHDSGYAIDLNASDHKVFGSPGLGRGLGSLIEGVGRDLNATEPRRRFSIENPNNA